MKLFYNYLVLICLLFQQYTSANKNTTIVQQDDEQFYTIDSFKTVEKIDAHVHVETADPAYVEQAIADNFKLITINYDDVNEAPPMEQQQAFALQQVKAFPRKIVYTTTISIRHFNEPGWQDTTINYLKNSFANGAIGVKIYKVIGMSLRDQTGKLVMIDDARFDSIFHFIVQNNKSVLGHLAEPKNCWLPLDSMTIKGDRGYYAAYPMYNMYKHPEFPSYEAQIAARDHMLERHPEIKFIGAHLGSLEWSVDELAKRLDQFPNMAVDMAARITHLQLQAVTDRRKVRDFIIKYQDRLLYATDDVIAATADFNKMKEVIHAKRISDWQFFTSNDQMQVADFDQPFNGLHLPKKVVDKIYRINAQKWYPGTSNFNQKN